MNITFIIKPQQEEILMESFWGTLTMIFAIGMTLFGLPSQIRKNYLEKRYGLSTTMTIMPLCVYISRIGYAIQIESWYLIIPDVVGLFFLLILMTQLLYYRKQKTSITPN